MDGWMSDTRMIQEWWAIGKQGEYVTPIKKKTPSPSMQLSASMVKGKRENPPPPSIAEPSEVNE